MFTILTISKVIAVIILISGTAVLIIFDKKIRDGNTKLALLGFGLMVLAIFVALF